MKNKPRDKWLSAFLTLLTMGVGHIYNGKIKRGIVIIAIHYIILLLAYFLLYYSPSLTSLAIIAFTLLTFFLYCLLDVLRIARKNSKQYQMQKYNKWYVYLSIAVIFVIFPKPLSRSYIKENVAKTFNIPAASMKPTLMVGDMVLAKTDPGSKSDIHKGELVIFNYPNDPNRIFIKRVIATEGDTLSIVNKKVLVNNIELPEPYLPHKVSGISENFSNPIDNLDSIFIPKGSLFVLGDNRDNSFDSRHWGFVKKSDIIGKAAYLIWSWDYETSGIRWNRIGKTLM